MPVTVVKGGQTASFALKKVGELDVLKMKILDSFKGSLQCSY